ncbi:MAG: Ig-like domain-containing protein [Candidatus Promineifilaceae bacterium]
MYQQRMKRLFISMLIAVSFAFSLIAILVTVTPNTHAAGPWYVNAASGDDANDCLSTGTACKTVGTAVTKAASGDTIHIAAGTYTENIVLNKSLTFIGAGANNTILDGGGSSNVIRINSGNTVTLSGVTIQNGSSAEGAGIYNFGTLSLTQVIVANNMASSLGGGILNGGILTITNSTIRNNTSTSHGGGIFNTGGQLWLDRVAIINNNANGNTGGIHNQSGGTADLTNVTISGNDGYGMLSTAPGSVVTATNSTIANNKWGVINYATVILKNSILAANTGNSGFNCSGAITSLGYNIDDDGSCSFSGTGDLSSQDPQLLPLGDYGGDTQTHALPLTSPAVDAGTNTGCPATDQRDTTRPQDGDGDLTATCDMGAYELLLQSPDSVTITGDTSGFTNSAYTFQASVLPVTTTQPITYTWMADGQTTVVHGSKGITDTVAFNWSTTGTKNITVTVDNGLAEQINTHQITIGTGTKAITSVAISGNTAGSSGQTYTFSAAVLPTDATQPITYTWQADDQTPVTHTGMGITDTVSFSWSSEGSKTITVTASNEVGSQTDTHVISLADWYVNAATGSDSNNCQSATTACKTIAGAIGKAANGDTIRIAAGTYAENTLYVDKSLTFIGAGADQTIIDGGGSNTALRISSGSSLQVSLSGMTIQNGSGNPGGIYNAESLTISDSVIRNNSSSTDLGGGILNDSTGVLTVTNSSLYGNSAYRSGSGIFNGGGQVRLEKVAVYGNYYLSTAGDSVLHNQNNGSLTLENVTVSNNTGTAVTNAGGTVTALNVTIASNSGPGTENYDVFNIKNSILANNNPGNSGQNCTNPLTSQGYNMEDGDNCALNGTGDKVNTNPVLGALRDNGGGLPTRALMTGSPAIDAGTNSGCPATDQRGTARPKDGDGNSTAACDMGAYEYDPANPPKWYVYLPVVIK